MSAESWAESAAVLVLLASPLLGWEVGVLVGASALAFLVAPSSPARSGERAARAPLPAAGSPPAGLSSTAPSALHLGCDSVSAGGAISPRSTP